MLQLIFFFFLTNSRQDQCTTEIQCHAALFITVIRELAAACGRHKGSKQRIGRIGDKVHIMLKNVSISQMALSLLHIAASSKPMLLLPTGIVSLFMYQAV